MRALNKILVVDDDPVVGTAVNRVLTKKGYVVINARNAAEAFEQMRNEAVDMVFTDIRMPGMNGLELAETVKARTPWTPVVIITGYGTDDNEARARAAGVTAFLHKPLTPEMIEGCAERALHEETATLEPVAAEAPVVEPAAEPTVAGPRANPVRNVALFLAAPFVGLAYFLLFPVIGLFLLARFGFAAAMKYTAVRKTMTVVKNVGLFLAAPFIGLAYAVLLPFVGMGLIAKIALTAMARNEKVRTAMLFVKKMATLVAAPFIGLAFIVLAPLVGAVLLFWTATRAAYTKLGIG
ncbi:MAG TPA: response regulator [Usitatibacteraceae bacterium]|nr:response regulator [Usitatibacteraceae bacterium]